MVNQCRKYTDLLSYTTSFLFKSLNAYTLPKKGEELKDVDGIFQKKLKRLNFQTTSSTFRIHAITIFRRDYLCLGPMLNHSKTE
jgi:hypothetical protein